MRRTPVWQAIRATLGGEIAEGHYRPGDKLPTEGELARRFGVNRHTVRRALADLTEAGITYSRRGAGVFVTAPATDYAIGRRVRFHRNVLAAGRAPDRQVLRLETRPSDHREAEALDLVPGDPVHVFEGISLVDAAPVAMFRSVFCATRFPRLTAYLAENPSVTAALAASGLDDYTRASTRLTAMAADAALALHLRIAEGAPVLQSVAINIDADGRPVEYGRSWWAGDRVTLTVDSA
jgi:GntR family phosphonate transport system transcriptional regulator